MDMPKELEFIISEIEKHGFEAFIVGGCVRDVLLNKKPQDWDITTNAKPEEIKNIFKRTIDTGIEHGTVSVLISKTAYEVTTYRIDGKYLDGRHPDKVEFSPLLDEDLKRRDFTINAMAYSKRSGIVDLFEGREDLNKGLIRCVGVARERFSEDALRILRAIRFSACLGFEIEEETKKAILEIAPNLLKVSKERVWVELNKTLLSSNVEKIALIFDYELGKYICPGFIYIKRQDKRLPLINKLSAKKYLRLAAFFADTDLEKALCILKELKSDNDTFYKVKMLLSYLKKELKAEKYYIKQLLQVMENENFEALLELRSILFGENVDEIKRLKDEIIAKGEAYKLSMLDITGKDLLVLGTPSGPDIGKLLNYLLDKVLKDELENNRQKLIQAAKEFLQNSLTI